MLLALEWSIIGACIFLIVSKRRVTRGLLGAALWFALLQLLNTKHFVSHRWESTTLVLIGTALVMSRHRIVQFAAPVCGVLASFCTPSMILVAFALVSLRHRLWSAYLIALIITVATATGLHMFSFAATSDGIHQLVAIYSRYLSANFVLLFKDVPSYSSALAIVWIPVVCVLSLYRVWRRHSFFGILILAFIATLVPRWSSENFTYVLPLAILAFLWQSPSGRSGIPTTILLSLVFMSACWVLYYYRSTEAVRIRGDLFYVPANAAYTVRIIQSNVRGGTFWIYPYLSGLYSVVDAIPFGTFMQLDPFLPPQVVSRATADVRSGRVSYILMHTAEQHKQIWGLPYRKNDDLEGLLQSCYEVVHEWSDESRSYRLFKDSGRCVAAGL